MTSLVSTYACDSCGCKHKASESIHVYDDEGKAKKFYGVWPTEKSVDGEKKIAVPMEKRGRENARRRLGLGGLKESND